MNHPTYGHDPRPVPDGPPESPPWPDQLAVALGNASLLGIGYLLLGRRLLAGSAALGTCVLLGLTASAAATWCEILLLLWWAAGIAHGLYVARRPPEPCSGRPPRGRRAGALAVSAGVLLTAVLLRADAYGIEDRVTKAREDGDCGTAVAAQREVFSGHRIAAAPVVAPGDAVVEACDRLDEAASALADAGRDGDVRELKDGFATLARVLREPGNDRTVRTVLNTFLRGLPTRNACHTADLTGWLRDRGPSHDVLDLSAPTVTRTEPAALAGCGDDLMDKDDWKQARARYRQLLDEYPDDGRTEKARDGVKKAGLALALAKVRGLTEETYSADSGYCDKPAKYGAAPPYRKGDTRALFLGDTEYTDKLPGAWRTGDPAKAALVVCAGQPENGTAVETCLYENPSQRNLPHRVTFHKVKIPLKVYELRTGKRVDPRKTQISGGSCPRILHYESFGPTDLGPGDEFVSTAKSDVRDAFRPVLKR